MKYLTFSLGLIILILAGLFFPRVNETPRLKTGITLLESPRMDLASVPRVYVEATVESVESDPNTACELICPQTDYPKDYAVLRIVKVITTHNTDMTSLTAFEIGKQVRVKAGYSVRPARIKYVTEEDYTATGNPDTAVSHVSSDAKPLARENGSFVYTLISATPTAGESKLPGLKPGDRIITMVDLVTPQEYVIGDYQHLQPN